jgi:hypothetical protein
MVPSTNPRVRTVAPLGIKPLKHIHSGLNSTNYSPSLRRPPSTEDGLEGGGSSGGHYEVLQKIVSSSPHALSLDDHDHDDDVADTDAGSTGAEIETCLEQFVDSTTGSVLWRRVVIKSGPACPQQVIHASYMLPEDGSTKNPFPVHAGEGIESGSGSRTRSRMNGSVLCWTAFPDRPQSQMLCVLANPTLLCIWDVYPSPYGQRDDLGGEGHTIPLPFEACGIHPVDANFGLLLQRAETVEDMYAFDYHHHHQNHGRGNTGTGTGEDDDDGFVLKAPPRPVRLRDSTGGNTFASLNVTTTTTTSLGTTGGAGVSSSSSSTIPSLFSMSHPLDDILPVSIFSEGDTLAAVATDVFEKILFVGVVKWVDEDLSWLDKKQRSQPVCVTYHSQLKR